MPSAAARRRQLYRLLGRLPPRRRRIAVRSLGEERRPGYVLERLVLDLNSLEPVPAYFVRPPEGRGPWPAVLYNHSHGGNCVLGKDELLRGREYLSTPPYADQLAAMGCAVLAIDAWAFGERRGRTESAIFKEMLWRGRVMWGMMVYDSLRAADYLRSRPDVDAGRIATLGMSMGSSMAQWVAALDERIRVCVDICCLTEYEALVEAQGLDLHGIYYYVPAQLEHFSAGEINALVAPRPHLGLAGRLDPLTPAVGLDRIDRHLRRVYASLGAAKAWRLKRYDVAHQETPAMRAEVVAFLRRWL